MTRQWAAALSVALALTASADGQQVDPRPSSHPLAEILRPTTSPTPARPPALVDVQSPPVVVPPVPGSPAASLQRPEPFASLGRPRTQQDTTPAMVAPVSYNSGSDTVVVRAQAPDGAPLSGPPPVVAPPSAADSGLPPIVPADNFNAGNDINHPVQKGFWEKCCDWFKGGAPSTYSEGHPFASDCCDCASGMISPLSNPFFFEDPRALTEVRPLFYYQHIPSSTPVMAGGHAEMYALQGRIALWDRFDLVINKLAVVSLNPHDTTGGVSGGTGFAELWLGPKYTFLRSDQTKTFAAVGLTFEIPIGSTREFQNTGTLGLDPYITFAQSFGASSYGLFNFMAELGYSFAVDDKRSEFFHGSLHLDYDVGNLHHFYPLLEMNWFSYTKSGSVNPFGFEGTDVVNFGSTGVAGHDLLTIAPGFRYKFNEHFQTGVYAEFPIVGGSKEMFDYRIGFDLIFRY
jgi:hypothetical protein